MTIREGLGIKLQFVQRPDHAFRHHIRLGIVRDAVSDQQSPHALLGENRFGDAIDLLVCRVATHLTVVRWMAPCLTEPIEQHQACPSSPTEQPNIAALHLRIARGSSIGIGLVNGDKLLFEIGEWFPGTLHPGLDRSSQFRMAEQGSIIDSYQRSRGDDLPLRRDHQRIQLKYICVRADKRTVE